MISFQYNIYNINSAIKVRDQLNMFLYIFLELHNRGDRVHSRNCPVG